MSRWADAAAWQGDGLRREVFFFDSRGTALYGSLYASSAPSRRFGVVACNSWGVEADRSDPLLRSVALAMARLGGAGLVFHYPGQGDSFGDLSSVGLGDLAAAAGDAVAEASRRHPDTTWIMAGFMFGASVACLARQASAAPLLLVQPALRPGLYFQRLSASSRPLPAGSAARVKLEPGETPGMAYGYPLPNRIVAHADEADEAVRAALVAFEGEGAVIRHQAPAASEHLPPRFEQIEAPGAWRFGSQSNPRLSRAVADWLDLRTDGNRR